MVHCRNLGESLDDLEHFNCVWRVLADHLTPPSLELLQCGIKLFRNLELLDELLGVFYCQRNLSSLFPAFISSMAFSTTAMASSGTNRLVWRRSVMPVASS